MQKQDPVIMKAIAKFERQGHDLEPPNSKDPNMRLYDKCRTCNSSLYFWATNGQRPCKE